MARAWQIQSVSWAAHRDQLLAIRTAVFVDEQGIPAEQEEDASDPLCQHVVAVDEQGHWLGTGRLLPDGHIGRMAVLAEHRGQGIGAALLKELMALGRRYPHRQLHLSAQMSAVDFYARHGFAKVGEPYDEVGIPHIAMRMDIADGPFRVESPENARRCVTALADAASHEILIYSEWLEPELYTQSGFLQAARTMLTRYPRASLRVLVHDVQAVVRDGNRLLDLIQRLPSKAAIRVISQDYAEHKERFMISDRSGYLHIDQPDSWRGRAALDDRPGAQRLSRFFDEVWEQGTEDPHLRQLGWG